MLYKSILIALTALTVVHAMPAPNDLPGTGSIATCNIGFYYGSGCNGDPDTTCIPDFTDDGYCYWNTWVGSAAYSCDSRGQAFPAFEVCNGDPVACSGAQSIGMGIDGSGCVEIGTYDGRVNTGLEDSWYY